MKKQNVYNIISLIASGAILGILLWFQQYEAFKWASIAAILHFIWASKRGKAKKDKPK